jgi:hypothetical protein
MKTAAITKYDPKKLYAAQNAQQGLISSADLSILTGVEMSKLNSFAKKGFLGHYGEYHGKRFFNFEEIINWLNEPGVQDEAKSVILASMKIVLREEDCPYKLEKSGKDTTNHRIKIIWKEFADQ